MGLQHKQRVEKHEGGGYRLSRMKKGATRTFHVEFDGKLFVDTVRGGSSHINQKGEHIRTNYTHNRYSYYTGTPSAAAKKVLSTVHKAITKSIKLGEIKEGEYNDLGIENAHSIKLMESTRGVRPSKFEIDEEGHKHRAKYVSEYFGWREELAKPKKYIRGGKEIVNNFKYVVIPRRGAKTAQEALKLKNEAHARHPKWYAKK